MKKMLFITGLLLAICVFTPHSEVNTPIVSPTVKESVIKEKNDAEQMHLRIETLSKDLRNSNFLTPRRTVQPFSIAAQRQVISEIVRSIQDTQVKGADRLQKISESVSRLQAINLSALLTCMGYHVYALREIII